MILSLLEEVIHDLVAQGQNSAASAICVTGPQMTFEGLPNFSLSWAAYAWKDKTKGLKIHSFLEFYECINKPKTSPKEECNA
ncbi:unnamed protein product [Prunus brigantina]